MTKPTKIRIGIMVLALLGILVNVLIYARPRPENPLLPPPIAKEIPANGLATTPRFDNVPGNPDFTVAQMKQVYQHIQVYKKRHDNCPPANGKIPLTRDMDSAHKEYGFAGFQESFKALNNPDKWHSDSYVGKKPNPNAVLNPYIFPLRPDGSDKCTAKVGEGRDILAMTDMYVHMNHKIYRGDKTSFEPIGFYMVLWDDGTVEKIPWQQARFAKLKEQEVWRPGIIPGQTAYGAEAMFPGQYGIEKVETETFAEHYHLSPSGE